MKKLNLFGALAVAAVAIAAISCTEQKQEPQGLVIEKQGVFSSGGRVTDAIPGEYDPTQNWLDPERKGTTTHVDHANTFYQIPVGGNGNPIVFLHGYGQTRTGWQSTPDGREGWSNIFLKSLFSKENAAVRPILYIGDFPLKPGSVKCGNTNSKILRRLFSGK